MVGRVAKPGQRRQQWRDGDDRSRGRGRSGDLDAGPSPFTSRWPVRPRRAAPEDLEQRPRRPAGRTGVPAPRASSRRASSSDIALGRAGRWSSRRRRRRRRRCARRAGSPRRRARPGSRSPSQRSWAWRTIGRIGVEELDRREDPLADRACAASISSHSSGSSGPGLLRIVAGDRDLADVVEGGGVAEHPQLLALDARAVRRPRPRVGDRSGVRGGVAVLGLERRRERLGGAEVGAVEASRRGRSR